MPFRAPVLPLLLVVLGLVGAPVAAAQTATTTTFGSPLENAPNVGPGCEARPWVASDLDSLTLTASGQPSCTWMQLGQFGVQADTRRGNAPGNGRITAVEVRSGPNPAPFRVTVLRQITAQSQNGSLGGTVCCTIRQRSDVLTPAPNTVSRFAVDLPVETFVDVAGKMFVDDIVGIHAQSGTGSLPLFVDGSQARASFLTNPGTLTAVGWWPSLGDLAGDAGAGRSSATPAGVGFEVLARYTFCGVLGRAIQNPPPTRAAAPRQATCGGGGGTGGGGGDGGAGGGTGGGGAGGGAGGGTGGPAPAVAVRATVPRQTLAALRRARSLRVRCALDVAGRCAARATVAAATARRLRLRVPRGARTVTIGSRSATLVGPGTATIRVPLAAKVRRALARARGTVAITVSTTATATGRTAATATTVLKARRR